MSIFKLLSLLISYPLELVWYIIGPIVNYLIFLVSGPLKLIAGTLKFGSILVAILIVPLSNYLVFRSKKFSEKHKFMYVSTVTILIGFIMVVTELDRIKDPIGLDDKLSKSYRSKTEISSLRFDYSGFETF